MHPVIESFENTSKPLRFAIRAKATGEPAVLAGYIARLDLRRGTPDAPGAIVLQIRSNGDSPILSISGNVISGVVSKAQLARDSIPAGDYCCQLILEAPGGTTYARGWFIWQHCVSSEGRS